MAAGARFLATIIGGLGSVCARIGPLVYLLIVTVVPISLMLIGYSLMFDDTPAGRPHSDDAWKVIALVLPAAAATVFLIAVPFIDQRWRIKIADIAGIAKGEYWAHWTYQPEEWRRFLDIERKETRKATGLDILIGAGFAALLIGLTLYQGQATQALAILGAVALLAGVRFSTMLVNRAKPAGRKPPVAYIARDFVLCHQRYSRFNEPGELGRKLTEIRILPTQPPVIKMTATAFRTAQAATVLGRRGADVGAGPPLTVYVPVPIGREAEAAALVARFTQEVIDPGSFNRSS